MVAKKSEKTYDKVLAYIKSEIRRGSLKRGDPLPPERDLAELLGVSRNSVREALRTMTMMGFVSSVQGAGNFLSCDLETNLSEALQMMILLGETNYLQVSQLRRGLESEMARLAVLHITPSQINRLDALAQKMATETDHKKGSTLDQKFHFLLCDAAGNKLISSFFYAMLTTVNDFISTMYVRIMEDETQGAQLQACHREIVEALRAHDTERATRAVCDHFDVVDRAVC